MGLGNRGSSEITGRGLLAIAGRGSISQINLEVNENYVVHPRLPNSSFRLQVPDLGFSTSLAQIQLFRTVRESAIWRLMGRFLFNLRTWSRRIIWGDRLFLQFQGPVTILLQTRGGKSTDILTTRDVSETADTPAGALETRLASTLGSSITTDPKTKTSTPQGDKKNVSLSFANVDRSGNVNFEKFKKPEKSGAALDQRAQK
ncbi:MAG: hypothetical protein Q9214_002267 [Letrouitia sp. 1 TL-2023]